MLEQLDKFSPKREFMFAVHILLYCTYLVFFFVFISAYLSPEHKTTIRVNLFNEGLIEFIYFIILGILGLVSIFWWGLSPVLNDKRSKIFGIIFVFVFIPIVFFFAFWLNEVLLTLGS